MNCFICCNSNELQNYINLHGHNFDTKCLYEHFFGGNNINTKKNCPCCYEILSENEIDEIGNTNTVSNLSIYSFEVFMNEIDSGKSIYRFNSKGRTLLHTIALSQTYDPDVLAYLANTNLINALDFELNSPLHLALKNSKFLLALVLIRNQKICDSSTINDESFIILIIKNLIQYRGDYTTSQLIIRIFNILLENDVIKNTEVEIIRELIG